MIPGKEYELASMELGVDNGQTATNLWLFVAAKALVGQIRKTRRRLHCEGRLLHRNGRYDRENEVVFGVSAMAQSAGPIPGRMKPTGAM